LYINNSDLHLPNAFHCFESRRNVGEEEDLPDYEGMKFIGLRFLGDFFIPSRQMLELDLKIGHDSS
jgi:hypothetical protein